LPFSEASECDSLVQFIRAEVLPESKSFLIRDRQPLASILSPQPGRGGSDRMQGI
jgi:hypothetical protein